MFQLGFHCIYTVIWGRNEMFISLSIPECDMFSTYRDTILFLLKLYKHLSVGSVLCWDFHHVAFYIEKLGSTMLRLNVLTKARVLERSFCLWHLRPRFQHLPSILPLCAIPHFSYWACGKASGDAWSPGVPSTFLGCPEYIPSSWFWPHPVQML